MVGNIMVESKSKTSKGDKNSLAIYNEILNIIKNEADSIIQEGNEKANSIKESMKKEYQEEIDEIIERGEEIATVRKNRIISSSEIEIRRINLTKKNEIIEDILQKGLEELIKFRKNDPNYKRYLLKFIRQGIDSVYPFKKSQLEGQMDEIYKFCTTMKLSTDSVDIEEVQLVIEVNDEDIKILTADELKKLRKKFKVKLTIEKNNSIIGGAIIRTSDNSVIYNNTFNERLERKKFSMIEKLTDIFWD